VGARGPLALVAIVAAVALGGCGSPPRADSPAGALGDDAITVASFDFPESELLAEIYGQALEAAGFEVRFEIGLGPREFVQPALALGLVELVPEYAGSALQFVSLEETQPTDDVRATASALERALRDRRLVALAPAPAQDANAVVVTRALAAQYTLDEISDLEVVASRLTFGGPPGCTERPFCLAGLDTTYGLDFAGFLPLDVGGPLTHQALGAGHVDVALLFTTDPRIATDERVVLADDRGLQPAENVTPVVHREVVERWGDPMVEAVDAVSRHLTTGGLQSLNARMADGEPRARVAADWLRAEGLA
jgi:osmoprotectant transport system substrate-binding protein